ncbi:MAG: P-type conjugative transfer protein TrbG [Candidatus Margulisbacteria bacterium]|nr:P-type conjugative transfer protein TrbG [Candidatus Margulisiibacteriota bacterium]
MVNNRMNLWRISLGIVIVLTIITLPVFSSEPQRTSGNQIPLSSNEKKGVHISQQWIQNSTSSPTIGENGKVIYLFGASLPSIVCSPLKLSDIELQKGEKIRDIHIGDKHRWKVTPTLTGSGSFETPHVIIKPTDTGLNTTMIIATNRRSYYIKLISQKTSYMPKIGFEYPEETEQKMEQFISRQKAKKEANTLTQTGQNIQNLFFNYTISGKAEWKPIRVYHDGIKTYIQMPKAMKQTEAPSLLIIGPDLKEQIVNYRIKNDRYIVDYIFKKAILIAGVGNHQQRITITRTPS